VVVPILLTFILGIIEIGRLVMVAQVNTNAAREAARYASQGGANSSTIDSYARTYLTSAGINGASSTGTTSVAVEYQSAGTWAATPDPSALPSGTPVRVTVSVNFNQQSWLPAQFFVGSNTRVQGVAIMRRE
jgi:Flp pilus assembly protein TadG